ncbi:gamma carbonic anhydrase family protein [Alteribacillus iranensis]|uniref:Carbonic anhydrase or acetyltransferase, isoleucine patch superfamily n=1 Tax=Alteribacillus iranensis TaxID=930128 RepID=A0A1I2BCF3_9BACI|nr:gamma carbonic anhydrase family protein [Alteribacillus iranensis]SFE53568.1 Carbonic anhydrase or acetyltransferase, isoleucine patch superfamily [Alteribacillus iranensis]
MQYRLNKKEPTIHDSVYIAPGAHVIGDVTIEQNASIWFNAVVRGDNTSIKIGERSNIQDGAVIHVDPGFPVAIGKDAVIGHNAIIHGCTIEDGALIGMGASVLNGAIIQKGALVAAGALITEGMVVEAGMLAVGTPAKIVKKLSSEQMLRIKKGANSYVEKGKLYHQNLEII